jgi:hypothetical protein
LALASLETARQYLNTVVLQCVVVIFHGGTQNETAYASWQSIDIKPCGNNLFFGAQPCCLPPVVAAEVEAVAPVPRPQQWADP